MSTELEELVEDFYDYFIDLYHQDDAHKDGEAFLAFQALGTAMTPEMFELTTGEFSKQLALEQFSTQANKLPLLEDDTIIGNASRTAEGLYSVVLFSAKSLPDSDSTAFDRFRSQAEKEFDTSKQPPMLKFGLPYHPAVATPPNWCDPKDPGGWTHKSFTRTETSSTSTETGSPRPRPRPKVPLRAWDMRVLPTDVAPALESPTAVERVMPQLSLRAQAGGATPGTLKMRSLALASESLRVSAQPEQAGLMRAQLAPAALEPAALEPQAAFTAAPRLNAAAAGAAVLSRRPVVDQVEPGVRPPNPAPLILRADVLAAQTAVLNDAASTQQVTSQSITVSFDYCLLGITRPWISDELFTLKNWYMDGYQQGELASGTGTGGKPFEVLPAAAIVVRNLTIKADWSEENRTVLETTLGFGPFSLQGRTYRKETGEILQPGMQIVAWVCEPMPTIPPKGDPGVAAAPVPPPA
ncbi:MAG: hypothetical protein V7642_2837 [Burkholderiales bacterium]|jgi:hypothetical protein